MSTNVVSEARSGRRVLVLAEHGRDVRDHFEEMVAEAEGTFTELRRALGLERIRFESGGVIEFITEGSIARSRSRSFDSLVATRADLLTDETLAELLPCLATSAEPRVQVLIGMPVRGSSKNPAMPV